MTEQVPLLDGKILHIRGRKYKLGPAEQRVLYALICAQGKRAGHKVLVPAASPGKSDKGWEAGSRDVLIVTISSLRKLGLHILNAKGRGYRLQQNSKDPIAEAFAQVHLGLTRLEKAILGERNARL